VESTEKQHPRGSPLCLNVGSRSRTTPIPRLQPPHVRRKWETVLLGSTALFDSDPRVGKWTAMQTSWPRKSACSRRTDASVPGKEWIWLVPDGRPRRRLVRACRPDRGDRRRAERMPGQVRVEGRESGATIFKMRLVAPAHVRPCENPRRVVSAQNAKDASEMSVCTARSPRINHTYQHERVAA
jgi:hypothetical protein